MDDLTAEELEFLKESNAIECVYNEDALFRAVKAWKYVRDKPELKLDDILVCHAILRPDGLEEKHIGKLRQLQVYIGGRSGASAELLPKLMAEWVEQVNELGDWKRDHIDYETTHPFVDGNGRTGRIFMNWERLRKGLPILVIKEAERQEYYKWFK